jgi:Putative heavy-metal chelation
MPPFDFGDGSDATVLRVLWSFAETSGLLRKCSTKKILSAFDVGFNVQFDPDERRFRQRLMYVALDDVGCVFYDDYPIEPADTLVGLSLEAAIYLSFPAQIAVLDALYSPYFQSLTADSSTSIVGTHREKAISRTKAICDEVSLVREIYLPRRDNCTVGLIGVSRFQAQVLAEQGFSIRVWDRDPGYIGQEILPGVFVRSTESSEEQLSGIDIALISGMTIGNNTLPTILSEARRLGVKTVCWAVTGSKLAPIYRDAGLTSAICEGFPPYFLPGETTLSVFRDKAFGRLAGGQNRPSR